MRLNKYSIATIALLAAGSNAFSALVTIDFESFQPGEAVNSQLQSSLGVSFLTEAKDDGNTAFETNRLWVFDSANPTGGDPDLATPGYGPNNNQSLGNIVIIQENLKSGAAPDDDADGGIILVLWDNPVTLDSIQIVDVEKHNADDISIAVFDASTINSVFSNNGNNFNSNYNAIFDETLADIFPSSQHNSLFGDNSLVTVDFGSIDGVTGMFVNLKNSSGGIGSITFDTGTSPVPEPATVGFAGLGLLGGLLMVRRNIASRKNKAK